MQPFPFLISVSQFTTRPWTFEEDVERYVRLGITRIEVCEEKLEPQRYKEQMRLLSDNVLSCTYQSSLLPLYGRSL